MDSEEVMPVNLDKYVNFLNQIKSDIQETQLRAAMSVTHELTQLYWRIGRNLCQPPRPEGRGLKEPG